ncbi:hypothetical protein NHX12_015976 [Muraenolepis orangiensis]|uniref:Uncharacterized protein n=1 Tax=Muraenolepis orangiensis TaxID=630683 RepID=A0A9Q0D5E2_9TELE|nr:hypothetical protein NHX12_015976 [Muraenolepis orangiensis]
MNAGCCGKRGSRDSVDSEKRDVLLAEVRLNIIIILPASCPANHPSGSRGPEVFPGPVGQPCGSGRWSVLPFLRLCSCQCHDKQVSFRDNNRAAVGKVRNHP